MATLNLNNANPATVNQLLTRINDPDPDFRFMTLNDLLRVFENAKPDFLHHDFNVSARTVDVVIKALDDQNAEVQNQALKCIGPLTMKIIPSLYTPMMEKISTLRLKNSVDSSIPTMATRAMLQALPRPIAGASIGKEVKDAYASINRVLIPRFLGRASVGGKPLPGLLEGDSEITPDSVDVLIDIVRCFGPILQQVEIEALHGAVVTLLEENKGNSVVKKRAVVAVAMLAHYLSESLLVAFVHRTKEVLSNPKLAPVTRRLYITILGSMARSIPSRFGRLLPELVPFILTTLGQDELQAQLDEISDGSEYALEFNEVREAALVALEVFLSSCPNQMRPFTDATIEACLRYLKFDPNWAVDDDEDMEDEEEQEEDIFEDDDEFEADGDFDDDDASWKVRRCAAKALYTLISTRSSGDLLENGVLYGKVAPALVKRFDEREESVRLEVLSAMSLLVRKTGEGVIPELSIDSDQNEYLNQLPPSRKRRRQSSGGGASAFAMTLATSSLSGTGLTSPTMEKIPASGPRADLAGLTPTIVKSAAKLLKGKLLPTKQATLKLLDDMVTVQRGGLAPYFDQIIGLIVDAIKPTGAANISATFSTAGGNASATTGTLKIAVLRLISNIAKNHSSAVLQPHLPKIVSCVISVVDDRYHKISEQAIQTAEEVVKTITPPRSRLTAQKFKGELQQLYDVIVNRTTANDADAEVRQKAIHALGTLLSRTSGSEGQGLLSEERRSLALAYLLERLKNETTRLAAVRAVDNVAALSTSGVQFETRWIRQVVVELGAQLRKANRSLRGSSIMALKHLVLSPATKGTLDDTTIQSVVTALIPVITNNDAQLLGPGLLVLAHLVQEKPKVVVTQPLIRALCGLLRGPVAGSVLDSLLIFVTSVGQVGLGEPLMTGLLKDVGVGGEPSVVGKVIGTLLVASGDSAGITLDSFVQEIKSHSEDEARASLALAVLGETGLRLGTNFPLPPDIFLSQFSNGFGRVSRAAAVALGRAGAGNVTAYLPVILKAMKEEGNTQYLLLQAIKEILQQAAVSSTDISKFSTLIWQQILDAAKADDNKAVCAECAGRMVIIDPKTYMPKLGSLLKDKSVVSRALAVQALRFTLPDENEAFDALLKGSLVDMLKTVLEDPDSEIRRHAMSTLNSAAHNKPELILGHLNQLLPFVMRETQIRQELIREVQMGPFKHIIDDGLEVRKAAYETLYALMESAFSRISIIDLYDRVVAGLKDDNDIRALCNLMVSKLAYLDPDETARRLDSIAEAFRQTLSTKLKDTAVKQEIEKQDEANKAVLRVTLLLDALKPETVTVPGSNPTWVSYLDYVNKDFANQIRMLRDEGKGSNANLS
ncbi:Cullin-associated NEDD8-dissociated protein 1, C-terminal part [Echria macrotheca]|uniref:Cullin-associated NEDD8-dissociated protein 1, C-terminal part n=1 Tax=Echria macrotheca TaxID=438768 RepID=A0AAJ0BM04_9PEZI|nr:Cullin-associated NEDD8-dissociated protein 1, C-terminal part [Echria macrotheca]